MSMLKLNIYSFIRLKCKAFSHKISAGVTAMYLKYVSKIYALHFEIIAVTRPFFLIWIAFQSSDTAELDFMTFCNQNCFECHIPRD